MEITYERQYLKNQHNSLCSFNCNAVNSMPHTVKTKVKSYVLPTFSNPRCYLIEEYPHHTMQRAHKQLLLKAMPNMPWDCALHRHCYNNLTHHSWQTQLNLIFMQVSNIIYHNSLASMLIHHLICLACVFQLVCHQSVPSLHNTFASWFLLFLLLILCSFT
jgi:hypothetical protein